MTGFESLDSKVKTPKQKVYIIVSVCTVGVLRTLWEAYHISCPTDKGFAEHSKPCSWNLS